MFQKEKKTIKHLFGGMTDEPLWQQLKSNHLQPITTDTATVHFIEFLLITQNLSLQWISIKPK